MTAAATTATASLEASASGHPRQRRTRLLKLESLRGLAAVLVVVHHACQSLEFPHLIIFALGSEAVVLFFLLSGFVIYFSVWSSRRKLTFRTYFIHRFRRIYPLFVIALVGGYALVCLANGKLLKLNVGQLAGNLLMLQDARTLHRGVWVEAFMDNVPLWSLSFEWWFYMMFFPIGAMTLIGAQAQKYVVFALSLASALAYFLLPNQISIWVGYFFIWWCGVEMAREYIQRRRVTWSGQWRSVMMLAVLAAVWSWPVVKAWRSGASLRPGLEPLLQFRYFADASTFMCAGLTWSALRFRGFDKTVGLFAILAPLCYALYICHVPLLIWVDSWTTISDRYAKLGIFLVMLLVVSYLLEVRLQPTINRLFDPLLPPKE